MKPITSLSVLAACAVTLSSAAAQTSVPVANFSFENPSTTTYSLTVPTSWAYTGNTQDQGVQTYGGANISQTGSANGSQLYFINSADGATVGQFLTQDVGTLLANTTYSLTVAEAVAPTGGYGSNPGLLELALFNGANSTGTLLNSRSDTLTPTAGPGALTDYTLLYTTGATVSGDLTIGLANNSPSTTSITQADYDNVRLTETAVPEPSTYAWMAAGMIVLVAGSKRFLGIGRV